MVPAVEEQVNFRNSCSRVQTKSRQGKQDVCPWCAEPAHRNGNTDCRAQAVQRYASGRMNLSSIACKHPIPNGHERTVSPLQSVDKTPIQSIHTTKYSQRSKELEERIHTVGITWKRYREKGSALRNKVLIPSVLCPRMVENIHPSHLGVENSMRNASDTLF
ncbi:hypothetical protein LSH36_180g05033 [Paralvinella palmiformis]|uniref:Uncharacterized protein n=1 Tax=Paralvinella palmiformis TaxID=53620 RepID=A0AAD9JSS0_9ANNE|nr:hypothetical protein LSH36_180g05033 [Paralvinella palmiformis]